MVEVREVELIAAVAEGWGWAGLVPKSVVAISSFGNVIIIDTAGTYWCVIPEGLSCAVIADDPASFENLQITKEFQNDWEMRALAQDASVELGQPDKGQCYCLRVPSVLGGAYSVENVGKIDVLDYLGGYGEIARQAADLPDGAEIEFEFEFID